MANLAAWLYGCFLLCAVARASHTPLSPSPPQPPAGIGKEQFEALVEAIGAAVVRKLDARQAEKGTTAPPAAPAGAREDELEGRVSESVARSREALAAFPELARRLIALPSLVREAGAGRSLSAFLAV
ncbi:hypothetical protein SAMN05216304_11291 [Bosea sp. OK403]|uniref:hypothetical protein n=1 Tax=Bosea sp. OK403 TaxID=1855286 RepID=UPI0008EC915D|nr:hypothetical protein [Bosea sp. OK403]SFJ71333.1 hypothetical protein SAMN05216304_11291 [Bosea sp. OK403]